MITSKEKAMIIHLRTKQDLENIKQKYGLSEVICHPNDVNCDDVCLMLNEFEKQGLIRL